MTGPQQPYGYQPPYGQPYQPVPPHKKRAKWPFVLAGVGVLMLVLLGGCIALVGAAADKVDDEIEAAASGTPAGVLDHAEDVEILSCLPGEQLPRAQVRVTNNSSEPSTYSIQIAFESPDGVTLYDTGYASVSNLLPGQTSDQDAVALGTVPADATCRLADATRLRAY